MSNKLVGLTMFVLGASIGSVVTWRYLDKKYKKISQEEIDSVKETFYKRDPIVIDNEEAKMRANQAKEKPSLIEYATKIQKTISEEQGYVNYSDISKPNSPTEEKKIDIPYVIPPDEFGELDEYETIDLVYYADKVLTDDDDQLVEDINNVVGFSSLESFGVYEDDAVFVRNDRLKCDYEILLDQRNYWDVIGHSNESESNEVE